MNATRRGFLTGLGITGALAPVSSQAAVSDQVYGSILQMMLGARPAAAAALFPFQNAIGSNFGENFDPKITQLENVGKNQFSGAYVNQSVGASFVAFLKTTEPDLPRTIMRLITASTPGS